MPPPLSRMGSRQLDLNGLAQFSEARRAGKKVYVDKSGQLRLGKRHCMVRLFNQFWHRLLRGNDFIAKREKAEFEHFKTQICNKYSQIGSEALESAEQRRTHGASGLDVKFIRDTYRTIHEKKTNSYARQTGQMRGHINELLHEAAHSVGGKHQFTHNGLRWVLANKNHLPQAFHEMSKVVSDDHIKLLDDKDFMKMLHFIIYYKGGVGTGPPPDTTGTSLAGYEDALRATLDKINWNR